MKRINIFLLALLFSVSGFAADGTVSTPGASDSAGLPSSMPRKLQDMGGGTFAEVVSLGAGASAAQVQGTAAQDAAVVGNPVLMGGRASAAAPTDVSADGDAVDSWHLKNGAQAVQVTAGGALVGGDAANGLDVDVTRLPALPTGTNAIGTVTAVGAAADGAAVSGNPVRIGGKDGSGNTQDLITDTTGNLSVGTGTAGTAAANVVTVQGIASATPVIIGGAVASGATDSGNPVKVGGVYNSTQPTLTNGQRGDLQQTSRGELITSLGNGATLVTVVTSAADAVTTGNPGLTSHARGYSFNGSTWDRSRSGVITPTATLTGHQNTLPWAVYNATPTTRTEGQGGPLQADTNGNLKVTYADAVKATYSASVTALAPAAAATDIFELAGSGTKTVKIRRIQISGLATAAGAYDFVLLKRSTANTVGTSSTPTVVPHDSNDSAGTAVVKAYTVNPTTGTLVGNVRVIKGTVTTAAGAIPNVPTVLDWTADRGGEPIVLRGTAQSLCINLAGATMTGGSLDIDIEWTEE